MWNMPKEGLQQLYEKLPGPKPPFEEAWRLTGGNPGMLSRLYSTGWNSGAVATRLIREKRLTPDFVARWRGWLEEAVEDPEALWSPDAPEELIKQLVERNLILYNIYVRKRGDNLGGRPAARDRPRTRHRQKCGLADPHT
jgi:hypothetical protein